MTDFLQSHQQLPFESFTETFLDKILSLSYPANDFMILEMFCAFESL